MAYSWSILLNLKFKLKLGDEVCQIFLWIIIFLYIWNSPNSVWIYNTSNSFPLFLELSLGKFTNEFEELVKGCQEQPPFHCSTPESVLAYCWNPAWCTQREAHSYMCQPADIHTQTHTHRHTYTQTMCHTASYKSLPPAAPTFGLTADTGRHRHRWTCSLLLFGWQRQKVTSAAHT